MQSPFYNIFKSLLDQDILYLPSWSYRGRAYILESDLHLRTNVSLKIYVTGLHKIPIFAFRISVTGQFFPLTAIRLGPNGDMVFWLVLIHKIKGMLEGRATASNFSAPKQFQKIVL